MRPIHLLLLLGACAGPETGIDNTELSGTASIPPVAIDEVDTRTQDNDALEAPQGLGPDGTTALPFRTALVAGTVKSWTPVGIGTRFGDPDYYGFTPAATGTFTISLAYSATGGPVPPPSDTGAATDTAATDTGTSPADTADTAGTVDTGTSDSADTGGTRGDTGGSRDTASGDTATGDSADTSGGDTSGGDTSGGDTAETGVTYSEAVVYVIEVYDAASGALISTADQTTDGAGGAFSMTLDLEAGTGYVVLVAGVQSPDPEYAGDYTLRIESPGPSDTDVLVGAYAGNDISVAESPLAGTTAHDWTYDATTYTWSGQWLMKAGIRALTQEPDTGTGYQPVVTEGASSVYVRAGTLATLNATPMAGALYTSTSLEVPISGDEVDAGEVVLDTVQPKVIGNSWVEDSPDTTVVELDSTLAIIPDTLVAQDLGSASGLGFVDELDGTIEFDPSASGWEGNDGDAFSFTVPEEMYVNMTASWADSTKDIDFGIWGVLPGYEEYGIIDVFSSFSDSYCLTGSDPEVCASVIPLEPDTTYYLVALGYLGTDDEPYHVELEWVAP